MSKQRTGILYGVGVGPGDPQLLTLKAVQVLQQVEVVFAASSPKNGYSLALNTAEKYIPDTTRIVKLPFPMTKDAQVLQQAWQENAALLREVLEQGQDAAFITIGDPLTYSTYGYLMETLVQQGCSAEVVTVPGVTAYHAAAAKLNRPLVESEESLVVVSGVGEPEEIRRLSAFSNNIVIMKAYRQFDQIVETVESLPIPCTMSAVSEIGLPGERVSQDAADLKGEKVPYLTLCIVKRQKDQEE